MNITALTDREEKGFREFLQQLELESFAGPDKYTIDGNKIRRNK